MKILHKLVSNANEIQVAENLLVLLDTTTFQYTVKRTVFCVGIKVI